jgi:hypothetical protein
MGRDDIYPVMMTEVSCQQWQPTSLLDIYHPDPWHVPVAASTVVSTPDDGRRKRPKHV